MKTYIFRPYYAYDCDSDMGFNNGHYLDEITVKAPDEVTARAFAMEMLADNFSFETVDADETQALDVDAAWTFDFVWCRGEEETTEEPKDDEAGEWEVSYLYKYLDLGEAETDEGDTNA